MLVGGFLVTTDKILCNELELCYRSRATGEDVVYAISLKHDPGHQGSQQWLRSLEAEIKRRVQIFGGAVQVNSYGPITELVVPKGSGRHAQWNEFKEWVEDQKFKEHKSLF